PPITLATSLRASSALRETSGSAASMPRVFAAICRARPSGTARATCPVTLPWKGRRARYALPSRRGSSFAVTGSPNRKANSDRTSEKTRSAAALSPGSIGHSHHSVHQPAEAFGPQRLAEVTPDPLVLQFLDGVGIADARDDDHRHPLQQPVALEGVHQLVAGHARHVQVAEHQVEAFLA